jgi:hypothetical protein
MGVQLRFAGGGPEISPEVFVKGIGAEPVTSCGPTRFLAAEASTPRLSPLFFVADPQRAGQHCILNEGLDQVLIIRATLFSKLLAGNA